MPQPLKRIVITTGDPQGIGTEVTFRALRAIGPQAMARFYVVRHKSCPTEHLDMLKPVFCRVACSEIMHAPNLNPTQNQVVDIVPESPLPAMWVKAAAQHCLSRKFQALVTAPLSKRSMQGAGLSFLGHTQMLKSLSGTGDVFMLFVGKYFNSMLLTEHMPLKNVPQELSLGLIDRALGLAKGFLAHLPRGKRTLPIGLLGLNPHAGEGGLIGDAETHWQEVLQNHAPYVKGPLVPDTAFKKANWSRFSLYICPYHDQALIPFKMAHGHAEGGAQISLGLPFVRTSVCHGTAEDLFLKNQACSNSMQSAIRWALKLLER